MCPFQTAFHCYSEPLYFIISVLTSSPSGFEVNCNILWTITCSEMSYHQTMAYSCDKRFWMAGEVLPSVSDRRRNTGQPAEHTSTNDFKMQSFISPAVTETYHSSIKRSRRSDVAEKRPEVFKIWWPFCSYPLWLTVLKNAHLLSYTAKINESLYYLISNKSCIWSCL